MNITALNLGRSFPRSPVTFGDVLGRIATWISVSRERAELAEMDAHMLADIGVTREQADREAGRPFWDTHPR